MVVDAGSGGVGVLDQIMYDEAYTKALSDGIDLLGGYGSRDNLAALEMAPVPATAGENTARLDGNVGPLDLGMSPIDGFAVRDLGLAPGMATGASAQADYAGAGGETLVADAEALRNAESDGPVASGDRDTAAIPSRDRGDATRASAAFTEPRAVDGVRSARVTTPTTRVLGAFDGPALASMRARELRRRFCDVFDAPPPTRRRDDETWLRRALAPHAIDATDDAAATPDAATSPPGGRWTVRGFRTGAARPGVVGPTGFPFPSGPTLNAGVGGDATDDDDDDDDDANDGRDDAYGAFGKTPSPTDRRRDDRRGSFDSAAFVPFASGADPATLAARSPTASEVLACVARRTPVSTCGWAMATAAAAKAIAAAGDKSARALSARAECERLAAEAGKAVKRAMKAAASAARVRDGTESPVPFTALPRAIAERVARTGAAGAKAPSGARAATSAPKSGGKRRRDCDSRRDSRSRSSSALPEIDAFASEETRAEALRVAEASRGPKPRMVISSLVRGDAEAAAKVAAIWHAAVDADACHVCGEGASDRWGEDDEIVFCDGCDVQVHLSCYGLKRVPKGKWLCQGCADGVSPGDAAAGEVGTCALCPQPGGALAALDPPSHWDVAWETPGTHAHVSCASCLPEVFVWKDVPGRETKGAVIDMSFVKAQRINLTCSLCAQEGACTQCAMKKCFATFHPLCARGAGFASERHATQDGRHLWFCKTHSGERWGAQRLEAAGRGGGTASGKGERKKARKASRKASRKPERTNAPDHPKRAEADPVALDGAGPDAEVARAADAETVETEA